MNASVSKMFPGSSIDALVFFSLNKDSSELGALYKDPELSLDQILLEISDIFSIPFDNIISQSRKTELVTCRQIFCVAARRLTKCSLKTIGLFLGGRDHTTALHNIDQAEKYIYKNDSIFMKYWLSYIHNTKLYLPSENKKEKLYDQPRANGRIRIKSYSYPEQPSIFRKTIRQRNESKISGRYKVMAGKGRQSSFRIFSKTI